MSPITWTARSETCEGQATGVIIGELGDYRLHARYLSEVPGASERAVIIIQYIQRVFEDDGIEICQTLQTRDVYLDILVVKGPAIAGWLMALGAKTVPLAKIEIEVGL